MTMYTPWLSVHETCDWQCHVNAHNSDLGDDFGIAVGYAIPAPFNGTVTHQVRAEPKGYPSLNIVFIQSDEDPHLKFEFMHLSAFVPDGHYLEKQTIGWSGGKAGAAGAGRSTGAHLHANAVVNGKLTPVRTAISEFASVGPVTPIAVGELGMDKFAINRTNAAGVSQSYAVLDYSTKTYRSIPLAAAEAWVLNQEAAAGRITIYPVSDATWASSYADWKPYAPAATGGSLDLSPVLEAIAKIPAPPTEFVAVAK